MEKNKVFKKFQSFQELKISKNSSLKKILEKIYRIFKENSKKLDNNFSTENQKLLKIVLDDLFSENKKSDFCFTLKENSIAESFGLSAFPYWVFLNPDGTVYMRHAGSLSEDQFYQVMTAGNNYEIN